MDELPHIFPIFFLTLGPLRAIPTFAMLSHAMETKARHALAVKATVIVVITVCLIAFVGRAVLEFWGVSLRAVAIAGGVIFLLSALQVVFTFGHTAATPQGPPPADPALSPLAVPNIVTPFGIAAILVYMMIARDNQVQYVVLGVMAVMIVLDFLGMWFAHQIMALCGLSILQVIAWIFAVMQAALAVQIIDRAMGLA